MAKTHLTKSGRNHVDPQRPRRPTLDWRRAGKVIGLVALSAVFTTAAGADAGLMVKQSAHDVATTLDRLEAALDEKGIRVLARVDHTGNAASVEMELPPTQLLIFGNPKLGTPLMQSVPTVAIDLPMKALAYEDENGDTFLVYNDPAYLGTRHQIEDQGVTLQAMAGALDALTDAATAE